MTDDNIIELVTIEEDCYDPTLISSIVKNEDNNLIDLKKCFDAIEDELVRRKGVSHEMFSSFYLLKKLCNP